MNIEQNFILDNDDIINNIVNYVSEKIKIQKERLKISNNVNITENYNIKLNVDKIYLFYFNNNKNIDFKIDDNKLDNLMNGILFNGTNEFITIDGDFNDNNLIKLFVIEDIINQEQLDKEQNDLMKYKSNNGIFIFENSELITNKLCTELIEYINEIDKSGIEKWGPKTNVNCKFVNIDEIKNEEIKKKFDSQLFELIGWIINHLRQEYNITCSGDSGYCLRKIYGPTRLHKDGININPIDNRYLPIRKIRNMSIIICLNDDYDGGEFYFPSQDYKIKLKKGQIIAFPPYWTHPHMVSEPTNNTYRYTINTWLYE